MLKILLLVLVMNCVECLAQETDNFKYEWLKIIEGEDEMPCQARQDILQIQFNKVINDSLVLIELSKNNIPFQNEFLLQIRKESGNYKSKLTQEYHNITGMKQPKRRKTLAIGTNKYNHASFNCWRECIADLKLFIEFSPPKENETFLQFMKRRGYNYTFK